MDVAVNAQLYVVLKNRRQRNKFPLLSLTMGCSENAELNVHSMNFKIPWGRNILIDFMCKV